MSDYQQKEYPQKDNAGALFTNQKKATDTDPNYKGEVLIGGNSFWVNGWVNTSQAGNKYMKLSFTPKDQAHNNGMKQVEQAIAPKAEPIPAEQYADTDIPF